MTMKSTRRFHLWLDSAQSFFKTSLFEVSGIHFVTTDLFIHLVSSYDWMWDMLTLTSLFTVSLLLMIDFPLNTHSHTEVRLST